jgi:hypothetical protein
MTTITIIIDDHYVEGYCSAMTASPEIERKCAAIFMAAMDAVANAISPEGDINGVVKLLIQPTIERRKTEAGLK